MHSKGYVPFYRAINGARWIGKMVKAGTRNFLGIRTLTEVAKDQRAEELRVKAQKLHKDSQ